MVDTIQLKETWLTKHHPVPNGLGLRSVRKRKRGERYFHILTIWVYAAVQDVFFRSFSLEQGV